MTEPILLTVLMTVHNGEPYLREAVASILNQTYHNFNFFILDNASSDDSVNIIKSFNDKRIKLIELSSNIGQTRALNMGLKIIKTKYGSIDRLKRIIYLIFKGTSFKITWISCDTI